MNGPTRDEFIEMKGIVGDLISRVEALENPPEPEPLDPIEESTARIEAQVKQRRKR